MSVFKYEDNTEEKPQNYDDLEVVINEGDEDEGQAPLGAEFPTEEDVVDSDSEEEEDEDSDDEDEDEDDFFSFKTKGVK